MAELDIDITQGFQRLGDFNARLSNMGKTLDGLEEKFGRMGGASGEVFTKLRASLVHVEQEFKTVGVVSKAMSDQLASAEQHIGSLFQKMAAENVKATIVAKAYRGEMTDLSNMLKQTANNNTYSAWQQKISTLTTKLTGENKYLRESILAADSAYGKDNAILKQNLELKNWLNTANQRAINQGTKLAMTYAGLNSDQGRSNILTQATINAKRAQITEEMNLDQQLAKQQRTLAGLAGGKQRDVVLGNQRISQATKEIQVEGALEAKIKEQQATLDGLRYGKQRDILLTSQSIKGLEQQILEEAKLDQALAKQLRMIQSLTDGKQRDLAQGEQTIRQLREEVTLRAREESQIRKLKQTFDSLNGGRQEEIAKLTAQNAARKRVIAESVTEKKVVDELTAAIRREENQLIRLQAQAQLSGEAHGRRILQLKQEIREQEALNRVRQMSTSQLLGFAGAQNKTNLALEAGSQSAAMFRAGLQGAHASIGMYTSATILAATATYALTASLRDSLKVGTDFSASMSRADAIMNSATPSWMTDDGLGMKAMTSYVRALGQSTIYTASQVADGLTELGMAGLSASDAITALGPSLTLANLAGVTMARSADIATNTMMTFGMSAKDLGGIVDVMAVAVSNSNSNIEELANALSYAGPAAHAAGISFKDVTSAVEALSNVGIKGSRAGTGLRKLFTSILNPTKKGQAVIEKYNLDIQDAEGNTRGLVDIVGQLSDKLEGLPPAEKLTAIQNLVGLYAVPAVSALVDQADNLAYLRRQLDETAGAAEKMQQKISDNLAFDWKSVLSSYEEVQLQAFDAVEMRLRETAVSVSKYLIELTHPISQVGESYAQTLERQRLATEKLVQAQRALNEARASGASDVTISQLTGEVDSARRARDQGSITELNVIMQKAENAAKALAYLGAGMLAYKVISGNVLGALASDLTKGAGRLTEFARRHQEVAMASTQSTMRLNATTAVVRVQGEAFRVASTGVSVFSASLATLSTWGAKAAGFLAGMSRFLGWAGLIAGVGYSIYSWFSSDVNEQILDQKNSIDELKDSYKSLTDQIVAYSKEKTKDALTLQVEADTSRLDQYDKQIEKRRKQIAEAKQYNLPSLALEDDVKGLQYQREMSAKSLANAQADLVKLGATTQDVVTSKDNLAAANDRAAQATIKYNEAVIAASKADERAKRTGINNLVATQAVEIARKEMEQAQEMSAQAAKTVEDVKARVIDVRAVFAETEKARLQETQEGDYAASLTPAGKMYEALKNLQDARKVESDAIKQAVIDNDALNAAIKSGDTAMINQAASARLGAKSWEQITGAVNEATAAYDKLRRASTIKLDLYNAQEALEQFNWTDQQKLEKAKKDLALNIASGESGPYRSDLERDEATAANLKTRVELMGTIKTLTGSIASAQGKAGKASDAALKKETQTVEQAQAAYDALAKKLDPVTYAQRELAKGTEAMTILRKKNLITAQQEGLALGQLNANYATAVRELDKVQVAMDKVRDSYNKSPFFDTTADLVSLNKALEDGKVQLEEYYRIKDRINTSRKESVLNGMPEVSVPSGSGPLTDWVSAELERVKGLKDFEKRRKELTDGQADATAGADDKFKMEMDALASQDLIKLGRIEEYNRKEADLKRTHEETLKGIKQSGVQSQKELQDSQEAYAMQSAKVTLAASLGSAENILSMFASASSDATAAQKVAFVAQKALAVAQIILYTQVAAAQAMALAIPGDVYKVQALALASFITATGYANAGLVAGLAIGELASGGSSGSGSGSGTKMYDTGGYIPYNEKGIVGEYGPELVSGPLHVRGRGSSSAALNGPDSAQAPSIVIAPQINVTAGGSDGVNTDEARSLGKMVSDICIKELSTQMRTNGLLDTWYRNKTGG